MKQYILFFYILISGVHEAAAQITGGNTVFKFLTTAPSARITALGGIQIAVKDDDVAFAYQNPAALNAGMHGKLSFNHNFYLSDIQHGYVAYGFGVKKLGISCHAGLKYLNYGDIKQADEEGTIMGDLKAKESAFIVGAARKLSNRFSLGLNLRFANSRLGEYKATAIASDAGLLYADSLRQMNIALVLTNYGAETSLYSEKREKIPYDVQLGFSKRLKYLPFRATIIMHHLQQWDIRYNDPNAADDSVLLFGEDQSTKKGNAWVDNLFRHFNFNGEFLLGRQEAFRMRFGYSHLRKRELSVRNYRSLAGFSGGIGIKIKRFRVDMGYAAYHQAGGALHFSLGTNLNSFF